MINKFYSTKFLGKFNHAIYKEDGTPWTQEEYSNVILIFEGPDGKNGQLCPSHLNRRYVTAELGSQGQPLYYLWDHHQHEQEIKKFTKISYEDLLKQVKIPLLKRK